MLLFLFYSLRVFDRSLSDSKSLQVSRTLHSILADRNNALVWIISFISLISNCFNPLDTVPSAQTTIGITALLLSAPITIGITVTFILTFCSFSIFILLSVGTTKFTIRLVLLFFFFFFFLTITRSGRLAKIQWSLSLSKFQSYSYVLLLSSLLLLLVFRTSGNWWYAI